jgi:UDP-N-acetylglucosamine--N-acetylmuramyl-(pentapeptide) pyrophosphoryl-undecaprenol N-acetylglucosamine transferase
MVAVATTGTHTVNASLHVLLAGGGTAGHVEPSLALADALVRRDGQTVISALGTAGGLETRLVTAKGYQLHLIHKVTMPRGRPRDWTHVPNGVWAAARDAAKVLDEVKPDVVVGFGGYVALPAYLAARRRKIPFVVHEANARPGVANRIGARLTPYVAVSTPATIDAFPNARLIGIPLRRSIATLNREKVQEKSRLSLGLEADRPTLLVFGGSQGAQTLNRAMEAAARRLLDRGVQVLHAVGGQNAVHIDRHDGDPPYVVMPYIEQMELAYAAADLVLSRSGAMTCAEIAAVGLPAVFVPYPHSNGEQAVNAEPLVDAGAAVMVRDDELSSIVVEHLVGGLVTDSSQLAVMSAAARALGAADADERLADLVQAAAVRR